MYQYTAATCKREKEAPTRKAIDTFNILPICPSRVLPPLQLEMPDAKDLLAPSDLPENLTTDVEVISWLFHVMFTACRCLNTGFVPQYFVQTSVEGTKYLVINALRDYRKTWLDITGPDLKYDELIEACLSIYNAIHHYTVDTERATDEARLLYAIVGEFIENIYDRLLMKATQQAQSSSSEDKECQPIPAQLVGAWNWMQYVDKIIAGRFYDSKKCTFTYSRISTLFSVAVTLYISQLPSQERTISHDNCNGGRCLGYQIIPERHVAKHTFPECDCDIYFADTDTVTSILSQPGLIPVIMFDKGHDLGVRIVPHTQVTMYITISYAASQLFASPFANSIPTCQLRVLRYILRYCAKSLVEEGETCGLWLDALLVPVSQISTGSREQALTKMHRTFELARVVLVVDPSMTSAGLEYFAPNEFMGRLLCSPWFGRLWTFSEMQLAANLWIWYGGQPYCLDEFIRDEGWPPSGDHLRRHDDLKFLGMMRHRNRLERLGQLASMSDHEYFDIVLQGILYRQTSQPSDEPFCLSLLMNLDTAAILRAPKEDRMRVFYSQLKDISAVLLVQSGERLSAPGYRWAPRTLLGRREIFRYGHEDDHTTRDDELGIRVPEAWFALRLTVVKDCDQSVDRFRQPETDLAFFRPKKLLPNTDTSTENKVDKPTQTFSLQLPDPTDQASGEMQSFVDIPDTVICIHRGVGGRGLSPCVILRIEADLPILDPDSSSQSYTSENVDKPRILTSYHVPAFVRIVTEKAQNDLGVRYGLGPAFDGVKPWTRDRLVLDAEEIDLKSYEVWVS